MPRRGNIRPTAALLALATALALGAACGSGASTSGRTELVVFAAASLTDAFTAMGEAFEAAHDGVAVTVSFGGSSSLREQILAGAPADVFASASPTPMAELARAGAVEDARVFATNRVQIAVPAGNPGGVTGLADLARGELLVGLCAPEVPCGEVARRTLEEAGVVPAPDTEEADVRALLTKLSAGELDVGLVFATDARSAGGAVEAIETEASPASTTEYPIAVVSGSGRAALAADFVSLVTGPQGRRILAEHGFGAP